MPNNVHIFDGIFSKQIAIRCTLECLELLGNDLEITSDSFLTICEFLNFKHDRRKTMTDLKIHFRHPLLFKFRKGNTTTVAANNICTVYGEEFVSPSTRRKFVFE